ncbi:transporter substrate-binding domain-containing protein [Roseibium sp.]|uniref:transporter substrate-binding domain-containing protein n=1 Tax=Roseibium sp. TaxID=1936156 RepID=UPI003A97BCB7
MTHFVSLRRASFAAAALSGIVLSNASAFADGMADAVARGSLRIGIAEENFVPWLATTKAGDRMGYEVDIAKGVAGALELEPVLVEMPFDQLLRGLTIGKVDVVISGMSVSAERAREVLFTAPYSVTDFKLVMDTSDLPGGAADNGYDVAGIKLGVADNTLADDAASAEFQEAELVRFSDEGDLRDAFLDGKVNGVIAPTPYPEFIVSRDPDKYVAEDAPLVTTVQAMAVRPDSQRFVNFLNAWLLENTANGTLEDIREHWFEGLEWLDQLDGYDPEATPSSTEDDKSGTAN